VSGSDHFNQMHQRKPAYPVGAHLRQYLVDHGREVRLPVAYADLLRFDGTMPVYDDHGRETLWRSVLLRPGETADMHQRLLDTYQLLIADGRHIGHLVVAGIESAPTATRSRSASRCSTRSTTTTITSM
jgi:hypothetical protein